MSFGPLSFRGVSNPGKQFHRPQIDVLVQFETGLQQDSFFQDARRHVGVADGAKQYGVELRSSSTALSGRVLPRPLVPLAAEVELSQLDFEA